MLGGLLEVLGLLKVLRGGLRCLGCMLGLPELLEVLRLLVALGLLWLLEVLGLLCLLLIKFIMCVNVIWFLCIRFQHFT